MVQLPADAGTRMTIPVFVRTNMNLSVHQSPQAVL